ncbi:class I SAM-dependent methyltransferase [Winogradskyella ouciana]|uniref:Methyltransferase domain-containing protein n=1 Tax=Winogradskyella ouciana TaxID=2608631 RepID=A0A7K1GDL1_9FLAO|nr:class I SAM-dependent methyltransferase [Winogradskyella ouciana]MTE27386.1 methyltransferase domain-containing protein [Winogradskyella ouciana]
MQKEANIEQNKSHYDTQYKSVNIDAIAEVLSNRDTYLEGATKTDISWVGMYFDNLQSQLAGKKVLELGCGDCFNVAIMASLGAKVYANDISDRSGEIINELNKRFEFDYPIQFISGDITHAEFKDRDFDYVIGKAFLHHLTIVHESQVLKVVSSILKESGEARFFEPAINSKLLDELRWAIPIKDRPSKLFSPKKFKEWEENDPHPHRDNSSKHFKTVGLRFFNKAIVIPLGVIERFHRLMPSTKDKNGTFKRRALKLEKYLPGFMKYYGARSQTVIYKKPKN